MQKAPPFLYGIFLLLTAPGLLLPAGPVEAEIYKWVDDRGVVHYQDTPPDAAGTEEVEVIEVEERSEAAVDEPPAAPPAVIRAPAGERPLPPEPEPRVVRKKTEVVLYTTSWCPHCAKARAWLRSRGIRFVDYDIERDSEAARRRKALYRKQGVPLAVINGRKILGFSAQAYEKALALSPPR